MKIIRVFPQRTSHTPVDDMVFIGDPPDKLTRPEANEVHVSCTFTWDKENSLRLQKAWGQYYPVVKIGGPAFDSYPDAFTPGLYLKPNIIFTSWGCNNNCPPCLVHPREGWLRLNKTIHPGNVIQDNNFLQCPKSHRVSVYDMLKGQKDIEFSGGLEADLLTQWDVDQMRGLRIHQLFFACDQPSHLKRLEIVQSLFQDMTRQKLRAYVLLAYNGQTIDEAKNILESVWQLGFLPHAQLYQPPDKWIDYSWEWKDLARSWLRPPIMRSLHKQKIEII
jgi:hypothetical protein